MTRKGTVIAVVYDDYTYTIEEKNIVFFRYKVTIKLEDGNFVEGKVDSRNTPPGPPQGWERDNQVDFLTEEKTTKGGTKYYKFKKPPRENSGYRGRKPMSKKAKDQIIRNVATQCTVWLKRCPNIESKESISAMSGKIFAFIKEQIPRYITEEIDEEQASRGVQGAVKQAADGADVLINEPKDLQHFFSVAESVIKYIMEG